MIGFIRGKIIEISEKGLTVDVHDIGYRVLVPTRIIRDSVVQNEIVLYTTMVVRENDMQLYGFAASAERNFFEKMISISGIGPGTALRVFGAYALDELMTIIRSHDVAKLESVPGIGKKTASRIMVELAQSLDGLAEGATGVLIHVREALTNLGYTQKEASDMTHGLPTEGDVGELLRSALKKK